MLISATRRQQASSTSLEESERQISMENTRERAQQLINIQQAKMCTKQNKQIQKEKEIEMKWRNPRKITIFFSRYCWLPQKQKKIQSEETIARASNLLYEHVFCSMSCDFENQSYFMVFFLLSLSRLLFCCFSRVLGLNSLHPIVNVVSLLRYYYIMWLWFFLDAMLARLYMCVVSLFFRILISFYRSRVQPCMKVSYLMSVIYISSE